MVSRAKSTTAKRHVSIFSQILDRDRAIVLHRIASCCLGMLMSGRLYHVHIQSSSYCLLFRHGDAASLRSSSSSTMSHRINDSCRVPFLCGVVLVAYRPWWRGCGRRWDLPRESTLFALKTCRVDSWVRTSGTRRRWLFDTDIFFVLFLCVELSLAGAVAAVSRREVGGQNCRLTRFAPSSGRLRCTSISLTGTSRHASIKSVVWHCHLVIFFRLSLDTFFSFCLQNAIICRRRVLFFLLRNRELLYSSAIITIKVYE